MSDEEDAFLAGASDTNTACDEEGCAVWLAARKAKRQYSKVRSDRDPDYRRKKEFRKARRYGQGKGGSRVYLGQRRSFRSSLPRSYPFSSSSSSGKRSWKGFSKGYSGQGPGQWLKGKGSPPPSSPPPHVKGKKKGRGNGL